VDLRVSERSAVAGRRLSRMGAPAFECWQKSGLAAVETVAEVVAAEARRPTAARVFHRQSVPQIAQRSEEHSQNPLACSGLLGHTPRGWDVSLRRLPDIQQATRPVKPHYALTVLCRFTENGIARYGN